LGRGKHLAFFGITWQRKVLMSLWPYDSKSSLIIRGFCQALFDGLNCPNFLAQTILKFKAATKVYFPFFWALGQPLNASFPTEDVLLKKKF